MGKIKGYTFAILSAISYGLIPLFIIPIKREHFPLNTTLFYRFFIAALFLFLVLLYKRENFMIKRKEIPIYILLGLFYSGSSDLLFASYDHLTPGIASTLFFVYPVVVVFIMHFFFKEKIKRLTLLSLLFTVIGIYVISIQQGGMHFNFWGLLIALGSATSCSLYLVTMNQSNLSGSGWKITFYAMVGASSYYLIKALFLSEDIVVLEPRILFDFTLFALITTVVSMTTLTYAIKTIGSTPTSILGALEPVVATGISVLLFGENLTQQLVLGILLILFGVILNIIADSRKKIV